MYDRLETFKQRFAADDSRRAALDYLLQAWEEAILDGVDGDCVANAAIFAAFKELVATYGEEAVARFAEKPAGAHPHRRIHLPGVHQ